MSTLTYAELMGKVTVTYAKFVHVGAYCDYKVGFSIRKSKLGNIKHS